MSYPILYPSDEIAFTTLGLGVLSDAISCIVKEKRNDSYELTMTYPLSGLHFGEIEERCLILAKPNYTDNPQPFRIYRITKPLNGIVTIYAQHISYDLSGYIVPSGISAGNLSAACASLSLYAHDFTIYNRSEGSATFKTDVPASVRSWLGGKEGSLIDLYGGEWHWDKFLCTLSTERGSNRGVTIRYGKNLTAFNQLMDCSGIYSHVVAYYVDGEGTEVDTFNNPVSTGLVLDTVKTLVLDASSEFDELPTEAQLLTYVSRYIDAHNLTIPLVNIELDFVQLQGLSERVDLCDSCNIEFEQLGVSAVAKCIEVSWDTLKERYVKSVFGMAKSTLADSISNISQEEADKSMQYARNLVNSMKTTLELAIDNATETITGNRGGYVVIHDADGDGEPDEILIMDTPDITTAVKVWRWNNSGLGYSSTGYSGQFGTAITADGQIVADFITAGTLSGNLVRGGTLMLGGLDNVNGVLQVLDASGNIIGQWNKDGATIAGELEIRTNGYSTNGKIITKEGSFSVTDKTGFIDNIVGTETLYGLMITSEGNPYNETLYFIPASIHPVNQKTKSAIASTGALAIVSYVDDSTSYYSGMKMDGGSWYVTNKSANDTGFNIRIIGSNFDGNYLTGTSMYGAFKFTGGTNTSFWCSGSKSRLMHTEDYADRLLYCYETPSPMFGDIGEATIGDDGKCYVWLDPIFAETISTSQYQVFLQKYGEGDYYISERNPNYFVVEGTAGLSFGWEIKAKQIDYTQKRLDTIFDNDIESVNYGDNAITYLKNLKAGRIV